MRQVLVAAVAALTLIAAPAFAAEKPAAPQAQAQAQAHAGQQLSEACQKEIAKCADGDKTCVDNAMKSAVCK